MARNLVDYLCAGEHPVNAVLRPGESADLLRSCIQRRHVHIQFTDTQGGTELGVRLDDGVESEALEQLASQSGPIVIRGRLVLDSVPVRCIARLDPCTFRGTGKLERIEELQGTESSGHEA